LACALALSGACSSPDRSGAPPRNLLLVSVDTLRADHVSAYGYERETTPNIDAFAAESVLFERAYSHISSTVPAFASVMTSKYPHHHGVIETYNFALGRDENTMAERLAAAGLRTAAFIGIGILMPRKGLGQGFETYSVAPFEERNYWRPAAQVTDDALAWLRANRDHPFFLWVHYFEPHQPYDIVPAEYLERFRSAAAPQTLEALKTTPAVYERRRQIIDRYDGALAWVDHQVGRLLRGLEEHGLRDRTMIVFTADHGEGLGEHGLHGHVLQIYEPLVHVPLVVHVPGNVPGRVSRNVEHVDVLPTVLHKLGVEGAASLDGRVLPLDGAAHASRDAFAETWVQGKGRKVMINDGRWKLILSDPGFGNGTRELYDLGADPLELDDVAAREPERAAELEARLRAWMAGPPVGHQFIGHGDQERAMLRALGYVE
jgi:arylsulfatase A-like enzyme